MAEKKYTERDFLTAVKNREVTDTEVEYAEGRLAKLNERNEKRKGENSKRAQDNAPIKEAILAYLTENAGVHTSASIGLAIGVSTAKVSSLCGQLAKDEKVTITEVKEKGKAKVNGYAIA